MKKINIITVVPNLFIGGLESIISFLFHYIDSSKFNFTICCLKELGTVGMELKKSGCPVIALQKPKFFKQNYFSGLQLSKLCKMQDIHIYHSHTIEGLIDSAICKFFNSGIKFVHTFHFGNYPHIPKKYLYAEMFCSRFSDQLVAVGNNQKLNISNSLKVNSDSIDVIWNGIPYSGNQLSYSSNINTHRSLIIGSVCTLIEQKGLFFLLNVARLLKKKKLAVTFLIAGEGHLRSDLEQKAHQLGLDNSVKFLGWVENAAVNFVPHVDIFFLPSLWEAMSVSVLEAMEKGKPVVVTDVGENRHVIENGVNGFVVPPKDVYLMAQKLELLIKDSELRKKMGARAREKIYKHCNVEQMVTKYERLYESLIYGKNKYAKK